MLATIPRAMSDIFMEVVAGANNFRQNQSTTVVVREEVKLDAQVVMKISFCE